MNKIITKVTELARPIIEKNDCELWGIEYVKEAGVRYLRVFIDRQDGVAISHCEAISRELDPLLDSYEELIPDSYTFEVSSAGAERRLRGPKDFERFKGHFVEVKLYKALNGKKIYQGNLANWNENGVELEIDGITHVLDKPFVASVRLRI
jgi:ribosome maturation factor RimP